MSVDADAAEPPWETTEMVNGILGCAECHGLLCVQLRKRRTNAVTEKVAVAMQPRPTDDIDRVLCASCGCILWERGGD